MANFFTYDLRCDDVRIRIQQRFQHIQNSTNVLSALLSNVNLWENPFFTTDFICTESADKPVFFVKFSLSHKLQLLNMQHNFC